MKTKKLLFMLAMPLVAILSLSCLVFSGPVPTPTLHDEPFEPVTTPLVFEPDTLPEGQVGVAYEVDIQVKDNVTPVFAMSISSGALPAGLELVFEEGVDAAKITGTPEETGTFTFTVSAACFGTMVSGQTGEQEYTIVVEE
jgi:hypothetical protein